VNVGGFDPWVRLVDYLESRLQAGEEIARGYPSPALVA
jgi:hypothetical protein